MDFLVLIVKVSIFITLGLASGSAPDFQLVDYSGATIDAGTVGLLLYNHGTVCDDYFSNNSANAICKEMGFDYANSWDHGQKWTIQSSYKITLDDVKCSAPAWSYCTYNDTHENCAHSEDIFLSCGYNTSSWIPVIHDVDIEFDLENITLEIWTDSEIGSGDIVRVYFHDSRGYDAGGVRIRLSSTPQYWLGWCTAWNNLPTDLPDVTDKVWRVSLNRTEGEIRLQINCNEKELLSTALSHSVCVGQSSSDVWDRYWNRRVSKIYFHSRSDYPDTASKYYRALIDSGFQLIDKNGATINGSMEGLLLYNRGTVCDDYFNDTSANAICRQIGYDYASGWYHGQKWAIQSSFNITLNNVRCSAPEWASCTYTPLTTYSCCGHSQDVFLSCGYNSSFSFQLVDPDGATINGSMEGLLLYNRGTVCDDYFNDTSANAICKQIGYDYASGWEHGQKWAIQTSYDISIDDVKCSGPDWSSCTYSTEHNCRHSEDVFLSCGYSNSNSTFQLVDSDGTIIDAGKEGLLLYNHGTVCENYFSNNSASTICKKMGLDYASGWSYGLKWPNMQYGYTITLGNMQCDALEVSSCLYNNTHEDCSHYEDVFLSCCYNPASCPPGKYFDRASRCTCNDCPADTFTSTKGRYECSPCPGTTTSNPGSTFCSCTAGMFWNQTRLECESCPSGHVSPSGALLCQACPTGYDSPDAGVSCSCPDGRAWHWSGEGEGYCRACPSGTYKNSRVTNCTACPLEAVSRTGSDRCICPSGMYWDGSTCQSLEDLDTETSGINTCPVFIGPLAALLLICSSLILGVVVVYQQFELKRLRKNAAKF